ncbi:hypothetical protein WKW79_14560 [Variovorax robiniae]|uniref:Uncharacterized protein n=1 Tax=Variovorax robiniae TaxID=1836199 RepID=A0ABU8XAW6_9BURK
MAKPTASEIQRSLASIEALCNYARAAVRLKMGDSAKLYRAEDDLSAAILALCNLRSAVAGPRKDGQAEAISAMGRVAADKYMRTA